MPVIVDYEVFKKVMQAFDENRALQAIAQLKQGRVVDVDEAMVYTQDAHFEGLAQVRYFAKPAKRRQR